MRIDCPYFDLTKVYPIHSKILHRYDTMLRPFGVEFSVRDTDHWCDNVRWGVSSLPAEYKKEVDSILKQFVVEFYSTCEGCGKQNLTKYSSSQDCLYYGMFPDEGLLCDVCRFKSILDSYDVDFSYIRDCYYSAEEDGRLDVLNYFGNKKIKFMTHEQRIGYCKMKDIKKQGNDYYLLAPIRPEYDSVDQEGYIGPLPEGYAAKRINPYAFDMGVRDIYGNRVYSTDTGCILKDGQIRSFDGHTLPVLFGGLKNIQGCPIIVKGDFISREKYIDDDFYRMTLEEFHARLSQVKR